MRLPGSGSRSSLLVMTNSPSDGSSVAAMTPAPMHSTMTVAAPYMQYPAATSSVPACSPSSATAHSESRAVLRS